MDGAELVNCKFARESSRPYLDDSGEVKHIRYAHQCGRGSRWVNMSGVEASQIATIVDTALNSTIISDLP